MAEYARRVVQGTSIVFIMALAGGIIGYITRLYLARTLSVEDYGLFYAILAFMSLFAFLKELGLNTALAKYIPDFFAKGESEKIKTAIFSALLIQAILAFLISMFFFFSADYWALNYFKTTKATLPLRIIALSFFVSVFMSVLQSTFQGFKKMKYFAMVDMLRIIFVMISLFGLIGLGVAGAAYAYLFASVIVPIIMFIIAIKILPRVHGKTSVSLNETKKMLFFGLPIVLASFGGVIVNYTDTLFLVYFRSLEEVGLYAVALSTSQLLWFFVGALSVTLLPTVSELWGGGKKEILENNMSLLIKLSFFVVVPLAIMMIAFSDNIIVVIFGGKYLTSAISLQILSIGTVFYAIYTIGLTLLLGIGKSNDFAKVQLISALCFVASGLLLIPVFGIVGAAMTSVLSYFISMLISFYFVRKKIEFKIPKSDILKIFLAGLLLLGLIVFIKSILIVDVWTKIIICTIIGTIFYLFTIFRIGILNKKEIGYMLNSKLNMPKIFVKIISKILPK